jgi:PAS domain S-box-containing protein
MTPDGPVSAPAFPDRLTVEHVVARALLTARTIDDAAPQILEAICTAFGWAYGALWAFDRAAGGLVCRETWSAPPERFARFDAENRAMTFAPGVGLPGRVWATGQPAWIPDLAKDANFPRKEVAAVDGLRAGFGFPVVLRGDVHSVMEFFSPAFREPDRPLLEMLRTVGGQIGSFIDRLTAQEDLDRFFSLSLDLICIAGFDGYFKRVNPAWRRVLGYTEAELLAQPYIELIHPADVERTRVQAARLNAGEEVIHFENRYRHKDGTHRWLLWTASPFPARQAIYAAARDITERKSAEQTMTEYAHDLETAHSELAQLVKELEVAKGRAEEASETRSAFLANMSHEIRTPLSAILGMTSLALATRLTPQQTEYLATVKSSAEALLGVIDDVLDFSKLEARRVELEEVPFSLRQTVEDAAKLLAVRASDKGLELLIDIHRDVPEALVGDPGRLRQVLLNIVGNAVKFTAAGEIVVSVGVEAGGAAADDRARLHFSVRDTGIGIAREKQAHIFQAFTQADNSTTRRYGGTGLGLAIAQRLVESMGGRLWVESEINQGATFHFTASFPEPTTAAGAAAVEPRGLEGLRALVVDDNGTNRRILEEMLSSWRMRPASAADARTGLAALRAAAAAGTPYEIVIADGQMPEIDGFELAQRIRRDRRLRRTRIVMLTSMGGSEAAARGRRAGIDACLTKPVKHSDLLDALTAIVHPPRRRAAGAARRAAPVATPRPLRILVAEDNAVNRKVIVSVLQRRGHRVRAVENGRDALDVIASGHSRPDVVVMDLQMPEMGGLEATQAIRAREATAGGYLPIVALTAHAMPGDRERCLAAGMDDYLPKPIDVPRLVETVERLGGGAGPSLAAAAAGPARDGAPAVFDQGAALARTGGDRRLLRQIVGLFRTDSRASLLKIERAIAACDADKLRLAAHGLKGSAGTIGAAVVRDAAAALEEIARAGELDRAGDPAARLGAALADLERALHEAGLVSPRRSS